VTTSKRSRTWILGGIVLLLAVAGYVNSVGGRFVWDDRMLILKDPAVHSLRNVKEVFLSDFFGRSESPLPYGYYRPLTTLSYMLDRAVWGLKPFGFHLTNISLHALASVLGFLLLLRLGLSKGQAGVAAALFAVHPVHTENVAWISGRTDLLAFALGAGAMLVHLAAQPPPPATQAPSKSRKRRTVEPRAGSTGVHAGLEAVALILFGLALLAKEMAVVIPAWIFLVHLLSRRESWRRSFGAVVPYGVVVAAYVGLRLAVHVPMPDQIPGAGLLPALATAPATILRYLGWLLSPTSPGAYVQNPYVRILSDIRFWGALLAVAAAGLGLARLARKDRRIGLLAAMVAVSLVPILNFVRVASPVDMGDTMAARFCYMPSLPLLALAVVLLTGPKWPRHALGAVLVAGLVGVGLANTWRRNRDWHDDLTLFSKTVRQVPEAPLPWARLGFAYLRTGKLEDARRAIARATALAPGSWLALNARVNLLAIEGKVREALPIQRQLVRTAKRARPVELGNLAYLERVNGHPDRARAILEGLVATGHASSDVWFNLAELDRTEGRNEQALAAYAKALADDSGNVAKILRFGSLQQRVGHFAAARALYERALRAQPGNVQARLGLADILLREGRRREAIARLMELRQEARDPRVQAAVSTRLRVLQGRPDTGPAHDSKGRATR